LLRVVVWFSARGVCGRVTSHNLATDCRNFTHPPTPHRAVLQTKGAFMWGALGRTWVATGPTSCARRRVTGGRPPTTERPTSNGDR